MMTEHSLLFGYHQVSCLRKGERIVYSDTTYLQTIHFDGVRNALKVIRIPFCGVMEGSRGDRQWAFQSSPNSRCFLGILCSKLEEVTTFPPHTPALWPRTDASYRQHDRIAMTYEESLWSPGRCYSDYVILGRLALNVVLDCMQSRKLVEPQSSFFPVPWLREQYNQLLKRPIT